MLVTKSIFQHMHIDTYYKPKMFVRMPSMVSCQWTDYADIQTEARRFYAPISPINQFHLTSYLSAFTVKPEDNFTYFVEPNIQTTSTYTVKMLNSMCVKIKVCSI